MNIRLLFLTFLMSATGLAMAAKPMMTKDEYENYSVKYRCIAIEHVRDLNAKEDALASLEAEFNINDDTYDEFDELMMSYEKDKTLLDRVTDRVRKECQN